MAILDADKEGFLRSDRSLIQTIGRTARNLHGKAILYGDKITGSMQKAIDETERRRKKQVEHNLANGIVPKSLPKSVMDIMEGAVAPGSKRKSALAKVAEEAAEYQLNHASNPKDLARLINDTEDQMYEAARNLEFEKAAQLRDQLAAIKKTALISNA